MTMDAYDAIITRTGAGGDWRLREPLAAACLSGHPGAEQ